VGGKIELEIPRKDGSGVGIGEAKMSKIKGVSSRLNWVGGGEKVKMIKKRKLSNTVGKL